MKSFDYASPETVEETLSLLGADGDGGVRPLAGGTDLLPLMKADLLEPRQLISLQHVSDLPAGIQEGPDGLDIGALTHLTTIERSAALRERYAVLVEAAEVAATPQLRNMATLGGNLLQRPRCWYFRNGRFHCWLKGGEVCQAREGENQFHALYGDSPCCAVHPSDLAPALLALDAEVRLRDPAGRERTVPLAGFFAEPADDRRRETTIRDEELILSVRVPRPVEGTRSTYLKAMDRKVWAFALVSVAARWTVGADGRIAEPRLVLGGVAPIPWRLPAVEALLAGAAPNPELWDRAAEAALADAQPLRHNAYKLPLLRALIRRALAAAGSA